MRQKKNASQAIKRKTEAPSLPGLEMTPVPINMKVTITMAAMAPA
jgi:hypothetical protein